MDELKAQILVDEKQIENCPICMDHILEGQICLTDYCQHFFCGQCLTHWSKQHNYCPICRQLFRVIIWINNFRYKNDFKLIVIENLETTERRRLDSECDTLRSELVDEIIQIEKLIVDLQEQIQIQKEDINVKLTTINNIDMHENCQELFVQISDEMISNTNYLYIKCENNLLDSNIINDTNNESIRSKLMSLRQVLVESISLKEKLNENIEQQIKLKKDMIDVIKTNIVKIDSNRTQNNHFFAQLLEEIRLQTKFYATEATSDDYSYDVLSIRRMDDESVDDRHSGRSNGSQDLRIVESDEETPDSTELNE